ncbi:MAG: serine/threonine protein kinase [Deltaproteobacteria bacterium]|nr:serine/threonine protein kinase [Deltaproteobacteria bacterium]
MKAGVPYGDYFLQRRIGLGGMAEVFLAKRLGPGGFEKRLVIKRILPHLCASPEFVDMFLREAKIAASLDHPNLAHVSDFGKVADSYYLAMEYVDGLTIADLLGQVGQLAPGPACRIAADVLEALHVIHTTTPTGRPLVHRDVSAKNVMVSPGGAVKLLDFGLISSGTDPGLVGAGTRRYMSPEQARGEPLDCRADLYALGVLLYQMLCGTDPPAPVLAAAPPQPAAVDQGLWSILQPTLAFERRGRPESARVLVAALELYVASLGAQGTRTHLAELVTALCPKRERPARRPIPGTQALATLITTSRSFRRRFVVAGTIVAIVLASGVAAVGLRNTRRTPAPKDHPPALATHDQTPPPAQPPTFAAPTPAEPVADKHPAAPAASVAVRSPPRAPPRPSGRGHPSTGFLTIDTKPWTDVFLRGRKLGTTPMENVVVPAGELELELKNPPLGLAKKTKVTVRPGQVARLNLSF